MLAIDTDSMRPTGAWCFRYARGDHDEAVLFGGPVGHSGTAVVHGSSARSQRGGGPGSRLRRGARAPEFSNEYARAKDESAHAHSERIIEIIDRVMEQEVNPNAGRVAIDGLKWIAARMMPKRYGDRIDAHLSGDITVQGSLINGH